MSNNEVIDAKQIHDLLLVSKPSEAEHNASLCPYCDESQDGSDSHVHDGTLGGDVSTYTQDDIDNAVAAATAEIRAELETLKQEQGIAEVEARLSDMTEAHEAKVAELQAQIDTAEANAEAVKTERDELVSYLDEVKTQAEAEQALAARREEVKEAVASLFSEEHIEANLDRWAALEAEAFESALADWTASAAKAVKAAGEETGATEKTAAAATAMTQNSDGGGRSVADIRRSLHSRGNVVRDVGASYAGGIQ